MRVLAAPEDQKKRRCWKCKTVMIAEIESNQELEFHASDSPLPGGKVVSSSPIKTSSQDLESDSPDLGQNPKSSQQTKPSPQTKPVKKDASPQFVIPSYSPGLATDNRSSKEELGFADEVSTDDPKQPKATKSIDAEKPLIAEIDVSKLGELAPTTVTTESIFADRPEPSAGSDDDDELQLAPEEDMPRSRWKKPPPPRTQAQKEAVGEDADESTMEGPIEDELRISDPIELLRPQIPVIDDDETATTKPNKASAASPNAKSKIKPGSRGSLESTAASAAKGASSAAKPEKKTAQLDEDGEPVDPAESKLVPLLAENYKSEAAWFREMVAFMADLHFIARVVALGLLLAIELTLLSWSLQNFYTGVLVYRMLGFLLMLFIVPLGAVLAVSSSINFSNVLEQTSQGNLLMRDWPEFEFIVWIQRSLYFILSAVAATIPGVLLGLPLLSFSIGNGLLMFFCAVAFTLLFPVLFTSASYNQLAWGFYSKEILETIHSCSKTWKTMYLRTAVVTLAFWIVSLIAIVPSFLADLLSALGMVLLAFIYFRVLGFFSKEIYDTLNPQVAESAE
jgi:hypothetical protein